MIPSFQPMPQSVAEKYSDDGGAPPKYLKSLQDAARYRSLLRLRAILFWMLVASVVGGGAAVFFSYVAWVVGLGVFLVGYVIVAVMSFKSYLRQLENANQLNQTVRMVDPLPNDHPDVAVVDLAPKKNGKVLESRGIG